MPKLKELDLPIRAERRGPTVAAGLASGVFDMVRIFGLDLFY